MASTDSHQDHIRRLTASDADLFRDHLLRLDPETRRDRFSRAAGDAFLSRYAESAPESGHVYAYVSDGVVRGVAELQPFPDSRDGEAAFTVEVPFRRRGVGSALFRRLVLVGRNRGVRILFVRCLPHNRAMQALARKHGFGIVHEDGDALGWLRAEVATPFSVMQEMVEASLTLPAAWLAASRRWIGPTASIR